MEEALDISKMKIRELQKTHYRLHAQLQRGKGFGKGTVRECIPLQRPLLWEQGCCQDPI